MYRNAEHYADPTAGAATAKVSREQRLQRQLAGMSRKGFYKSAAWRRARDTYISQRIALDGGMCESCHQALGRIVHHVIWLTDQNVGDPDISLNPKNFKYECQECHNKEKDPNKVKHSPGRCDYGPTGELIKRGAY